MELYRALCENVFPVGCAFFKKGDCVELLPDDLLIGSEEVLLPDKSPLSLGRAVSTGQRKPCRA